MNYFFEGQQVAVIEDRPALVQVEFLEGPQHGRREWVLPEELVKRPTPARTIYGSRSGDHGRSGP